MYGHTLFSLLADHQNWLQVASKMGCIYGYWCMTIFIFFRGLCGMYGLANLLYHWNLELGCLKDACLHILWNKMQYVQYTYSCDKLMVYWPQNEKVWSSIQTIGHLYTSKWMQVSFWVPPINCPSCSNGYLVPLQLEVQKCIPENAISGKVSWIGAYSRLR